ncbi:MAG: transcription-repair coupling factor [Candidatus Krumholzibacteriota bacterium]|nr:transcription-repair coupling factor [Candidatus Krumholzibacteriota bacterium]
MALIDDLGPLGGEAARLREALAAGPLRRTLTGLKGSSLALLLARLDRELNGPAGSGEACGGGSGPAGASASAAGAAAPWVVLTSQASEAEALAEDLQNLGALGVHFLPELEILPYDRHSAERGIISQRVEVLEALADGRARFLLASVRAWMRRVMPPEELLAARFTLRAGMELDLDDLAAHLEALGYRRVGLVEEPGDFAVKGGIVDLFTPTCEEPHRLEFFDEELASVRRFDPATQRSTGRVDEVRVLPCTQVLTAEANRRRAVRELRLAHPQDSVLVEDLAASFLAGVSFEGIDRYSAWFVDEVPLTRYLPARRRTVLVDEDACRERWEHLAGEARRRFEKGERDDELLPPPERAFLGADDLAPLLDAADLLLVEDELAEALASPRAPVTKLATKSQPSFGSSVGELREDLARLAAEGYRVWIFCDTTGQADRLGDILAGHAERLHLPVADLQRGFLLPEERVAVYTDHEIFERYKRLRRRRRLYTGAPIRDRATLRPGDFVVHIQHGVARYRGMKRIDVLGEEREVLHLSYADEQQLYVPVEQIHLVERYVSQDDGAPRLNRLGEKAWQRTRKRAEKAVREMAMDLLQLYARRQASRGHAFPADTPWQKELEASFLYQDTPDQATAAVETKADMEKARPMDRLVCGDVGFGKTEVAVRAAFKAIQDGKQVAVLVPTTILAQQHLQTFSERLRSYPVRIAMVSRFRSAAQNREALRALAAGELDLVIGTHRLLSKDVRFKDLGLLVVDEEHRFGVAHKEKLKRARSAVDVLTLTATPIPRTLHMSLGGLRDISLIRTPPRDRLPVHTEITPFDEEVMREAVLRELDRGGQVFFVHNRVETIDAMAAFLQELLPDVKIVIGHGQMPEKQLEKVMVDFIAGEYDVLVSTMIIESGLDIPRVNTILVNRADRFGLAQLHQLRGRVGRSRQRAYAHLMIPRDRGISDDSRKRLEALVEHDELGAGYKLALRDLEIRGAGNMLGAEQHGHVAAVGFDLYLRLVNQAVRELREGKSYSQDVRVESELDARLPDDYVPDAEQKMMLYQRMGHVDRIEQAAELAREIRDRFGPPPPPVENLLLLLELKILAQAAGVSRLRLGRTCRLEMQAGAGLERAALARLAETFGQRILFKGSSPLVIELKTQSGEAPAQLRNLLRSMEGCATQLVPSA